MKRVISGAGALIVLIALLFGAPLALATWWGNPWPAGGWSEIQLLTNDTFIGALVVIGWLAWAQMTACILIEIVAALRHGAAYLHGDTAHRVKFAPAGQQELARFLVASVAALGLGTTAVAAGGAALYSTATTTAATAGPSHADTIAAPSTSRTAPESAATAGSTITTQNNTTAWRLAEIHLDDGTRWEEILDLNRGSRLPDGTTFATGTQTIPAGTALRLPADATATHANRTVAHAGQAEKQEARHQVEDSTYQVVPGDTLWDISEVELGAPFRYVELYDASKDTVQPHGEHLTDPDLIKPGWTITIPGARATDPADHDDQKRATQKEKPPADGSPETPGEPGPEPSQQPTPQAEASPRATPAPVERTPQTNEIGDVIDEDEDVADHDNLLTSPWVLSGLTGSGVLLAGALLLGLRQRRSAQFRARRPGRTIAAGGPELAAAEMTITAAGNLGGVPLVYLDAALRRLAGAVHANRGVMPAVAAVEIHTAGDPDSGRLTLHLSDPGDLPRPWQPTPDRLHWHIPTTLPVEDLGSLSDEADAPYPLLVTIGQADTGELWLLNCEDLGILTLAGDPDRGRDLARHLVAQLAVNPWSQGVTVDCIGIAAEAEPLGAAIRYHATPAEAAAATDDALAAAVAMVDRAAGHKTDVATARTGQADDDVWPSRLLLLDTETEEPAHLAAILELVDTQLGRTATSIVLTGQRPDTPGTRLVLSPEGRVVLEQAGLDLVAVSLTSDEARGVGLVYAQSEVLDDAEIPVDLTAEAGWEVYADYAGGLRREHTMPRDTPESELAELTTTVLDDDDDYLSQAAVVPKDLEALAPRVPISVRSDVEDTDPTLDRDVADWHDENSGRGKISLLGPVLVRSHGKPLAKSRPFFTELAAFLWLHPNGATRDEIVTAFGTARDTVRKRMNVLRDWLGTDPLTGKPYLPNADQAPSARASGINVYQLGKSLLVDWDLFKRLRVRGEARGGEEGRADLVKALDLVTGRPCDHCREQGWQWLAEEQRHDHYMQVAIADVALTLTTAFLRDGDTRRARAATEIAMLAAPDEEATRLSLVQITSAEGNRAEAERILREDICNRSDDGEAPTEINDRTRAIIANHNDWMVS